ncbi:uncharacterized protein LOC144102347 [Amblyomma americanum]
MADSCEKGPLPLLRQEKAALPSRGRKKSSPRHSGSVRKGSQMAVLPAAEQGPHSQVAEEVPSLPQADKDASYWPVSDKQLPSLPAGSATPPALPGLEERPALMSSQTEPAVLPGIEKEALASGSGKGTPRSSRSGKGSVRSTKTEKDPFPLSNQPSTSPPQPPRGRNSSLVKGVAVLLVLVIALLVVMVILKGAKPPPKGDVLDGNACQSDDCKRVARLLLESLQPNAPPCADFYQLVCGRWKHAVSSRGAGRLVG